MTRYQLVTPPPLAADRIRVGISRCLLGESVRFDGGHKRDAFINDRLGRHFEFVSLCPEVAIGLGIPRPPIRLVGDPERPKVLGAKDPSIDVTARLTDYARCQAQMLSGLSGFILKKDSPSCGMERVRVYGQQQGMPARNGSGVFALELMRANPWLPVEEEGRLNDPLLRENFVTRVFVYHRWQRLLAGNLSAAALLDFHARHKYLLMGHSQAAYQRMGRMLSHLAGSDLRALAGDYEAELMGALKRRVTRQRHVNVLQHIMGYLKTTIDGSDKRELTASIESYRRGEVPLVVPLTLLRHYFRRHPDPYIERQVYLRPHPEDLGLLNQV